MPNIASVLKSEISRLARKEVRAETDSLKEASTRYRSDIAALRKQIKAMESQIRQLSKGGGRGASSAGKPQEEPTERLRFSAKGLASRRRKLGLSAEAFGALIGVTGQSIYKWETGKATPRAAQLKAIAGVRSLGKREANARLAALQP
ncbi:helix-turn-helix domain-containing protein [Caenimonas aquaedulcis]|uniref:Helix-turn-helix transcriptional regulator n=1 Tax=Caenimonas aquaedulcis TaxID=2793270 RepID=A0A931MH50_9BURK|nr:helix-turn-helix transcriptional regulator [Caenimonas aquaedulcis]MBG9388637.1 helix-turn-helix transcriptional regulator [Caenimonas aquaedulcis]